MFLFGARDVWFVVGIPVYFQAVLSDGTREGRHEAFPSASPPQGSWRSRTGSPREGREASDAPVDRARVLR
jgi:hypothetical protein